MTRAVTGLATALAVSAAGAWAQSPLSAIDWLSDSIDLPEAAAAPAPEPPRGSPPPVISVAPLDQPVPDLVGFVDPSEHGVTPRLWGHSAAADVARAIAALPETDATPPVLKRFLRDLLVMRLDAPIDALGDDSLFLARLDRLLAMGHLQDARRLVTAAGMDEPRRFRRAFDIALLQGTETEACQVIEETPEISPTYPARIFCLARNGNWDVAALTLGNAEALGILSDVEDQLLLHFLDPELFEGEPVPQPPRQITPLTFRLYEAVGERLSTDPLPVAFAMADMTDTVGWKTRLRAAERLAAAGAIPVERLLSVYLERKPAASGSIWDRVDAVQQLVSVLDRGTGGKALASALPPAWAAAQDAGYAAHLAHWLAPRLDGHDLDGPAGHVAFEIALLAGAIDVARGFASGTEEDRFLLALASGQGTAAPTADELGRAVLRGLSALEPGPRYQTYLDDGRPGEALLRAMSVLMDGAAGNPDATADAIALLRALGLEALAQQVAVELVLAEGAA